MGILKFNFKDRFSEALEIRGMSQTSLSEKTGLSISAISKYKLGRVTPSLEVISALAKALDVSELWLLGFDHPMTISSTAEIGQRWATIPVLGRVQAGIPTDAVEEIIDWVEIPVDMAATGDFFALKIKGRSMEPKISDGDVVVVRKQADVESGDIGVVLVNGSEATVKRIIKHDKGISLVATNPEFSPRFYTRKEILSLPVQVLGRVVQLISRF